LSMNKLFQKAAKVFIMLVVVLAVVTSFAGAEEEIDEVDQVKNMLFFNYVEPVSWGDLEGDTIEEILENLDDPYTIHLSREEFQEYLETIENDFSGIGVQFEMIDEGMLVTSVMPDTPAEDAGMQEGDIVVEADGVSLEDASNEETVSIVTGEEGTDVSLVIKRNGEFLEKEITRAKIDVPSVRGEILSEGTGYINTYSFSEETPYQFEDNYVDLRGQGARSWIVDLRYNSGGFLEAALELSGFFLEEGETVMRTKNYNLDMEEEEGAREQNYSLEGPVILLVNEYSASASEIIASALRDHNRAFIVGETTFGKGSVQQPIELVDGSVLNMTVSYFYSPEGGAINEVGVEPHLDLSGWEDEQQLKAAELLQSGSGVDSDAVVSMLYYQGFDFAVNVEKARKGEYWPVYYQLVERMGRKEARDHFYPRHSFREEMEEVESDHDFAVRFSSALKEESVHGDSIQLREKTGGGKVDLSFNYDEDNRVVEIMPEGDLEEGEVYWLLFGEELEGMQEEKLSSPVLVEVPVQ